MNCAVRLTVNDTLPTIVAAALLLAVATASAQETDPSRFPAAAGSGPWIDLFDGKTLDGWSKHGGAATYGVEAGCIVGRTAPNTPNTFLCTERTFADFELSYEFRVDPALNSGVQIRSRVDEKDRVRGYQVEIDIDREKKRFWTGGIYDEGGRGWLADLSENPEARGAAEPGGWNAIRVLAEGGRIRTWVNGVAAADLLDVASLEGIIGLQVHGVGAREEPLEVRWRNIRLRPLGRTTWAERMQPEHWRYSSGPDGMGKTLPVPQQGADWRWTRSGWGVRPPAEGTSAALVGARPSSAGALRIEFHTSGGMTLLISDLIEWGPSGFAVRWRDEEVPMLPGVEIPPLDTERHHLVLQHRLGRVGVTVDGVRVIDAALPDDGRERGHWSFRAQGPAPDGEDSVKEPWLMLRRIEETSGEPVEPGSG